MKQMIYIYIYDTHHFRNAYYLLGISRSTTFDWKMSNLVSGVRRNRKSVKNRKRNELCWRLEYDM